MSAKKKTPSSKTPKPSSRTPRPSSKSKPPVPSEDEASDQIQVPTEAVADPAGAKDEAPEQAADVAAEAPVKSAAPSEISEAPPTPRAFAAEFLADGIAVLRLDVPGESVNTIKARFAEDFAEALGELEIAVDKGAVRGVVLTSGKKDNFLAGADIHMLKAVQSAAQATQLSQRGQQAMQRIEDLGRRIPVVAAIHGACLGGGLELALACTARVCSDDAKTTLGLPEVQLGLIPGAGGTQRLPRLIGLEQALELVLTGKQVKASKALRMGLCDEVVPQPILLQVAIAKAQKLAEKAPHPPSGQTLSGTLRGIARSCNPPGIKKLLLEDNPLGRKILFETAKKELLKKTRGRYPAPERALEVMRTGLELGPAAGYAAEARVFGGLVVSRQSSELIGIFQATTALKKDRGSDDKDAVPRPVSKVGVLGAGLMGAGIAYVTAAQTSYSLRLKDKDSQGLSRGMKYVRDIFDERVKKKSLPSREAAMRMARVTPTVDYSGFADCEVVIEAVFEDLALKQAILRDVEAAGRADVIFASNTSSLPISRIAEASSHPETVIGMHYFSPVHKMPLLEIIVTEKTAPWVTATCVELGKRQGKTVIVVRDGVGFYTSRILGPYMNEAAYLLAAGVSIERIDEAMLDFGFPVGPLTLLDEVGIDVAEKVGHIVQQAFGERLAPPPGIKTLVQHNRYGKKNGRGFYRYDSTKKAGKRPVDTSIYGELGLAIPAPSAPSPVSSVEIQFRCALAMVNEAALCLGEGILRSPRDGDIGAIFGLGFPPFLGGPFRFADSMGISEVVRRLSEYQKEHGIRFSPAPLLIEMARTRKTFY